jgi:hypothetical protein
VKHKIWRVAAVHLTVGQPSPPPITGQWLMTSAASIVTRALTDLLLETPMPR